MKILQIAIVALVHLGLWMLFVSDVSIRDFVIGLVAVGLTSAVVVSAQRLMRVQFRPTVRELAEAWRIPWYGISGTFDVVVVLAKQLFLGQRAPSVLSAIPFDPGGDDAHSAARRALALTYTTITPNSIVLGLVRRGDGGHDPFGTDVMLCHYVRPGPVRQMTRNLGARVSEGGA